MPPTSSPAEATLSPERLQEILNGSAMKVPSGATQHLDNYWEEEFWWYVSVVLCMGVTGLFILARIYTKLKATVAFDAPDYLIFVSYFISITGIVFSRLALSHGFGAHQWNVQLKHFHKLLYYVNLLEILYGPLIFCLKLAVILQLLRIFAPNRSINPSFFYASYLIIAICGIFYTVDTLLTIYACTPREKIWNKLYTGGHCINYHALIASTGFFNIVSDFAILILPIRSVWNLRIPTKKKIAVSMLFCTGLIACIASVMRIVHRMRIVLDEGEADVSYNIAGMAMWSYAEVALVVIVACTITLPQNAQGNEGGGLRMLMYAVKPFEFVKAQFHALGNSKSEGTQARSISEPTLLKLESWDGMGCKQQGSGSSR